MELPRRAADNFDAHISRNPYPGRGIVAGRDGHGDPVFVYWIMGRSENSRNRRFVAEQGRLRTEPADPSRVEDPSLIIYEAMLELPGLQIVSNGDQTRTIFDALQGGGSFDDALQTREREPDAPNYTPRISALYDGRTQPGRLTMSIIKASQFDPDQSDHFSFRSALPAAGFGLCLTTYAGDGSPLPSFRGEPLPMPCDGSPGEILDRYWGALDGDNKIALAVKSISREGETRELLIANR